MVPIDLLLRVAKLSPGVLPDLPSFNNGRARDGGANVTVGNANVSMPPVRCHMWMKHDGLAGKENITMRHRAKHWLGVFFVTARDLPIF
jgi:hypothetical protein